MEAIQIYFGINPGSVVLKPNLLAAFSLLISLHFTRKVPLFLLLLIPLNSRALAVVAFCRPDLSSGQLRGCLKVMAQIDLPSGLIAFNAQKHESD